jgi:hypothetical protein
MAIKVITTVKTKVIAFAKNKPYSDINSKIILPKKINSRSVYFAVSRINRLLHMMTKSSRRHKRD